MRVVLRERKTRMRALEIRDVLKERKKELDTGKQ